MAESAEEVHARVVAQVGEEGRLPAPDIASWDVFPWEVAGDEVVPKVLRAPADEPPRWGEAPDKPCGACAGFPPERVVWEDEHWVLTHDGAPSGLPVVVVLHTRAHLDLSDLDDELASQLGRITTRLVRIIGHLDNIGRVHVNRWGDGSAHFHLWFFARTARLAQILGSYAVEWDEVLPPGPEDVWRADLHTVGTKLANWGGHARM
jgi:diadenosine tetraphosphate (Ap4A) HIT family hydrolase